MLIFHHLRKQAIQGMQSPVCPVCTKGDDFPPLSLLPPWGIVSSPRSRPVLLLCAATLLLPQLMTSCYPLRNRPVSDTSHASKTSTYLGSLFQLLLFCCGCHWPATNECWRKQSADQAETRHKEQTCKSSWDARVSLWPNQFNSNAGNQIVKAWTSQMQICIKCWHHYVGPGWQDEHIHEATWYLIPEHLSPSQLLYIVSPSQLWLASLTRNNNNYTLCVITGAASPRLCFRKIWITLFRFSIHCAFAFCWIGWKPLEGGGGDCWNCVQWQDQFLYRWSARSSLQSSSYLVRDWGWTKILKLSDNLVLPTIEILKHLVGECR